MEQEAPKVLTNKKIIELNRYMSKTLSSTDENGRPDIEKIVQNAACNMGDAFLNIDGILLQEENKLSEIENNLKNIKATTYDNMMRTKLPYEATNDGIKTMVDGQPQTLQKQHEYNQQKNYVEYLKRLISSIQYYPRNAKAMSDVAIYGIEHGTFIALPESK